MGESLAHALLSADSRREEYTVLHRAPCRIIGLRKHFTFFAVLWTYRLQSVSGDRR